MRKLFLVPVVAVLALAGCAGSPTYKSSIQSVTVVNDTQVSVTARVTNNGSTSDTPVCSVDVFTSGGTDVGSNTGQLSTKIGPGKTITVVLPIDVKSSQNLSPGDSQMDCS